MSNLFQTQMLMMGLHEHLQQAIHDQGYSTLQEAYNITIEAEAPTWTTHRTLLLQTITKIKDEHQQQEEAWLLHTLTDEQRSRPTLNHSKT